MDSDKLCFWRTERSVDSLILGVNSNDVLCTGVLRWDDEAQSRFIESLMLGLSGGDLWVSGDRVLSLLDGKQRILTLKSFLGNNLALKGMEFLTELEGMKFADMHPSKRYNLLLTTFSIRGVEGASDAFLASIVKRVNK